MRKFLPFVKKPPFVPVIRLQGQIGAGARALNDAGLAPLIERAFTRGRPAAVALVINSPGGSPAQSALIAARIRRLADQKKIPVHAFVEDVAASGGYWLACAADDIQVDASSILGSIGVISSGFGFHELIARHGIERRVHTAGRSKGFGDPFRPETEADVARIEALLGPLHENFIAWVKARRGAKLAEGADLFNADIWLGARAVELGLADGLAHLQPFLEARYGAKLRLQPLGRKKGLLNRFGLALAEESMASIEERVMMSRYGL
ncbi:S49 family peptidase [Pseudogemmobacter faecipullorum]|uniref:S49 family peptidase n=1 Tax=Pseudogemmobacter faecipullorum TaxID=2755041 RepID=A0ABS8CGQ9_9RHOB|nr:S49 family peptidase [Pseudogemmobacter faecipullorum]MCB5408565.1 S49 family peptidase [Pseudogemmobacter faecipullorum]